MYGATPTGETPLNYPVAEELIRKVLDLAGRSQMVPRLVAYDEGASAPSGAQLQLLDPDTGETHGANLMISDLVGAATDQEARRKIVNALWDTKVFGQRDAMNPDLITCENCKGAFPFKVPDLFSPNYHVHCPTCDAVITVRLYRG